MNTFRIFSESRSFISLSLLFLLISTFMPVCHAEAETAAGVDHHLSNASGGDRHTGEFGHTGKTADNCCSDLSAQVNVLPLAVASSIRLDLGDALPDVEALIPVPLNVDSFSAWRSLHFEATRLSVYLLTRRLRI